MDSGYLSLIHSLAYYIPFLALGACVAFPLIVLNIRWAAKLGLLDWPKTRGVTQHSVPIVGPSLVAFSLAAWVILSLVFHLSPWLVTLSLFMALMGYFDDKRPIPAVDKLLFQVLCAVLVVAFEPDIQKAITLRYGFVGGAWAVFFILGLVNAVNFIDGIDGLAGVVIMVGAMGYVLLSTQWVPNRPQMIYALLLLGMMLPFLYFNVLKRKCFMGNIGSYFFSFLLAVLHLSIPLNSPGIVSRLSLSGLCFLIPIADSIVVFSTRLVTLRSPFQADRGHLHHRLLQTSLPLRWILICFGVIEISALLVAGMVAGSPYVNSGSLPALVGISHIAMATLLIWMIEKSSKQRLHSYFSRMDEGEPIYFLKYRLRNTDGSALSVTRLRRIEAKVSAEVRVTDLVIAELPDQLFITLRGLSEPLKSVSSRLEQLFYLEKIKSSPILEQGEFRKIALEQEPKVKLRRVK